MDLKMKTKSTNNKKYNLKSLQLQFLKHKLLNAPKMHVFISPSSHIYEKLNSLKKLNLIHRKDIITANKFNQLNTTFDYSIISELSFCLDCHKKYNNKLEKETGRSIAINYTEFLEDYFSIDNNNTSQYVKIESEKFLKDFNKDTSLDNTKIQEKFPYADYEENDWISNYSVLEQSTLYNTIENKAQELIKKYNLNSINIVLEPQPLSNLEKQAQEILDRLIHIDKAIDIFMGRAGIKTEYFGFNERLSISIKPIDFHASFDSSSNTIALPVVSDYKDKSENYYMLSTASSILHEWVHAIDFNSVKNIYDFKEEASTSKKPNINNRNNHIYTSEQKESFFLPSSETQLYHSYFAIRDTIEGFITNENEHPNREQRNQEIIKSFIYAALPEKWLENKTNEQQEIILSEKAFISLRNSIVGNFKNTKNDNFISFIKENNIPLSTNEEHILIRLIQHPQFQVKMKSIINNSESLYNKSGNEYLRNSKTADSTANEKIFNKAKEAKDYELAKISKTHRKSNNDLDGAIEEAPFIDFDSMNYFQNPAEMLARYFEKNMFPHINSNTSKESIAKQRKIYPSFVDKEFSVKKDVIFASIFGIDALSPVQKISEKITKSQISFNEIVKTAPITYEHNISNKEFFSKHLNPSSEFKNLVKNHRALIEQQNKTTTQSIMKP